MAFQRATVATLLCVALLPAISPAAEQAQPPALTAFEARLAQYVEIHRRLEGPLPPVASTTDIDEVHRLMDALRSRIRAERVDHRQGHVLSAAMSQLLRDSIRATLTIEDIIETVAELEEHTPPGMPAPQVNQPLPEDAPRVMIAPQLLRRLPPLPNELRYVVLAKSLVIWDFHSDLVVDIAPGLFDPASYSKSKTR